MDEMKHGELKFENNPGIHGKGGRGLREKPFNWLRVMQQDAARKS